MEGQFIFILRVVTFFFFFKEESCYPSMQHFTHYHLDHIFQGLYCIFILRDIYYHDIQYFRRFYRTP